MAALAPGLPRGLEVLQLQCNRLGAAGAAALAPALARLGRSLRELDLEHNGLDDGAAAALAPALGRLGALTRLSLQTNPGLGPAGVARLPFGELGELRRLNLWNCDMCDAGCAAAAPGLARCAHLEAVNLRGNQLGPASVEPLLHGLRELGELRRLNLACNPVVDAWVNPRSCSRIKEALPDCDVMVLTPLEARAAGVRAGRR